MKSRMPVSRKGNKKTPAEKRWSKYNSRRRPPSHTVEADGKVKLPKAQYARLKTAGLRIRADQEPKDDEVVSCIAESFVVTGQVHPVIVRRVGFHHEVVWGADVVAAGRAAKVDKVECQYFEGSDDEARLLQIAEVLFRQQLTALEKAEHWAEWADGVLKAKGLFSGQPVPKRGRPEGELLKAARLLPAFGTRTVEARKKMLARAYKVARLSSDVKEAVKTAGLDDNQNALLAIASAGGAEAQHRKLSLILDGLAEVPEVQGPPLQPAASPTEAEDEEHGEPDSAAQSRPGSDDDPVEGSTDGKEGSGDADDDGDDDGPGEMQEVSPDTDFKQLREFLKEHGGTKLWAYAPMTIRKEFVDWLTARRCRANSDVEPYVKDVFAGREQIEIRVLKAHAASKGLSEKQILTYLKSHGYLREKTDGHPGAPWIYKNADPNFRGKQSSINQTELEAPYEDQTEAQIKAVSSHAPANLDRAKPSGDYYDVK